MGISFYDYFKVLYLCVIPIEPVFYLLIEICKFRLVMARSCCDKQLFTAVVWWECAQIST